MELPYDVLRLVKEYSMPLTRPDWRTLHKMPFEQFKTDCYDEYLKWYKNRDRYRNPIFGGSSYLYMFHWSFVL